MLVDRRRFLVDSGLALAGAAAAPHTFASEAGAAVTAAAADAAGPKQAIIPGPDPWADVRAQFVLAPDLVHLSTFFLVSHPRPVREAVQRYRDQLDANPLEAVLQGCFSGDDTNLDLRVKRAAARYIGGKADEIALTQSTTMGLAFVYEGLVLAPGQEILTTTHDHFVHHEAIRLSALRSGASVRKFALYDRLEDLPGVTADQLVGRLRAAIRPETRVLGITWVHSSSGLKLPLRPIAVAVREANAKRDEKDRILLVVDGVHGFGVEDETIAETGVDVFVAGTHKWILGPRGTGLVWAPAAAWAKLRPSMPTFDGRAPHDAWEEGHAPAGPAQASWFTAGGFHAFEHEWAVEAAFDFHASIGRKRIADRIHALNGRIKDGLAENRRVQLWTPRSAELSAGLVGFDVRGLTTKEAVRGLHARKILASGSPYPRSVARLAAGIMNTPEEIDAALAAVASLGA